MPLLENSQLFGHGVDVANKAINIGLEVATDFGERCQAIGFHRFCPFSAVFDLLQFASPFVELRL